MHGFWVQTFETLSYGALQCLQTLIVWPVSVDWITYGNVLVHREWFFITKTKWWSNCVLGRTFYWSNTRVKLPSERSIHPPWSLMWLDVQYWRGLEFGIVNYNTADVYPPERLTWRNLVNGARQSCVCLIIFCLQIRSRGIRGVRLLGGSLW